jgi:16S rRNA (cytosine967-C5)-methyltransferase
MKRDNVFEQVCDSKVFNPDFKEKFDVVLCDAPCSGSGVINDNPDMKLNKDSSNIKSLNVEQLAILKNVSSYVKKGGYLYYSTCSIMSSENMDIIRSFMSDIKGFELCEIDSKLQHETIDGANLFLPDVSCGLGFFVAKLKRVN